MNQTTQHPALLPSGLFDLIGAEAEAESALVQTMLEHFRGFGYVQVQPPLMEFTSTLLQSDEESELAKRSFRLTDPVSQQMMALRADMTMQIARIASNQLKETQRPLRLCYAGQTLRALPDSMRQTRQFRQMGIELFGSSSINSNIEVMQVAVSALQAMGIADVTLDISCPNLLKLLLEDIPRENHSDLLKALSQKDATSIKAMGYTDIANLCQPIELDYHTDKHFQKQALSANTSMQLGAIEKTVYGFIRRFSEKSMPRITLDLLETRGLGYHEALSFAIYIPNCACEVGRGGSYTTPSGEAASGFTFYTEDILPFITPAQPLPKLMLPVECPQELAIQWRNKGYQTLYALDHSTRTQAKEQQCQFFLDDDLATIHESETL